MQNKGNYYLTTAIAYTSGKPHIGNVYEIILTDSLARFKRLEGYNTYLLTGTDEHGQKNEIRAAEEGVSPQEFVDKIAAEIKHQWDLVGTSYNDFIRTTEKRHTAVVQKIFKKLYEQGDIYKGHYEGLYCTPCESFFTESQLKDGRCPDCGGEVKPAQEEAYFFKMSKYADRLIEHINNHPEFIQPVSRKNEMMNNFLLPGLQDLCVSRTSFSWGIPIDFDSKHVIYVWLDALTNYITAMGYDIDGNHGELFKEFWPADVHVIGKDIVRFHTIYWPIFLMALDLPLPKQVFGHPWLMMDNGKMSKSKGNVIYADELIDVFGVDAVRYYLLHEMPYDNDGNLTWEFVTERVNSDLANTLGNLVNRTVAMTNKYFDGKVSNKQVHESVDDELHAMVSACRDKVQAKMNAFRVSDAVSEIMNLFKRCNKYIDETLPWALAKDESKSDRLQTVLYNLLDSIYIGTTLLSAFLPQTAEKIFAQLNVSCADFDTLNHTGLYPDNNKVTDKPEILFARFDLAEVLAKAEEIHAKNSGESEETKKLREEIHGVAKINIDLFGEVDLRVAEITACEPIKRAKKLLKLTLNDGTGIERTVASGIAKWYKPEDLVGHKVIVVANLKPAVLCGVESQGMILAADVGKDVKVIFVDDLTPGAKIR